MNTKVIMLDIETTGINPKVDDILQITMVQMVPRPDGYYEAGKIFNQFYYTDKKPTSIFAIENMQECYKKCNELAPRPVEEIRKEILDFLSKCGCIGPTAVFCGQNASGFDVPFLVEKGYLMAPGYANVNGKEVKVGDFNYRIYELSGLIYGICDALSISNRNELIERCIEFDKIITLPVGNRHDGLIDCLRQLKMLNSFLCMIREQGALISLGCPELS
jgi:hypothetical protein